jgi:membrane peptidoglycan carboxypeptidase
VLANAYATIAAQGVRADPYVVVEVKGANGGTRYAANPKKQPNVFGPKSKEITSDVIDAMRGVIREGTGRKARDLDRPAAGKTGTAAQTGPRIDGDGEASYNVSAWFAGFTPQLSTAVGFYRDPIGKHDPKQLYEQALDGVGQSPTKCKDITRTSCTFFGGGYPTEIWTAFMKAALKDQNVLEFPEPAELGETRNARPSQTARPSESAEPSSTPTPTPDAQPVADADADA